MNGDWAASALKWWQEAGVDTLVAETPRDWLNPVPAAKRAQTGAPAAAPAMPDRLDAFQDWLLSDDIPLATPTAVRVGPAGDPESGLMIMVDMPSAGDVDASSLLSGEAGALFDKMIGAIGRSRETLYLAPLSPIRTPTGTLPPAAAAELAAIARHHVGLVAPKALLLFGDACANALLGAAVAQTRGKWHELETPTGKIRTLVTIRPEKLIQVPAVKKHAWDDLKMLREGLES